MKRLYRPGPLDRNPHSSSPRKREHRLGKSSAPRWSRHGDVSRGRITHRIFDLGLPTSEVSDDERAAMRRYLQSISGALRGIRKMRQRMAAERNTLNARNAGRTQS